MASSKAAEGPGRNQEVMSLAEEAASRDIDRFMSVATVPGIPRDRRQLLHALIVLHHELARVPGLVSEPMLGAIRLQWWREQLLPGAIGGPPELVVLRLSLEQGLLEAGGPLALIDAFEALLDEPRPELRLEAETISGRLQQLVAQALDVTDADLLARATALGTAYHLALAGTHAAEARALLGIARRGPRPPRPAMGAFTLALLVEHRLAHGTSRPAATMPWRILLRGLARRI